MLHNHLHYNYLDNDETKKKEEIIIQLKILNN